MLSAVNIVSYLLYLHSIHILCFYKTYLVFVGFAALQYLCLGAVGVFQNQVAVCPQQTLLECVVPCVVSE